MPIGSYLALELLFGGIHIICTVAGILRLQTRPIYLNEESDVLPLPNKAKAGCESSNRYLIPPPDRKTITKLVTYAGVLSLGASLPLNFAPKV